MNCCTMHGDLQIVSMSLFLVRCLRDMLFVWDQCRHVVKMGLCEGDHVVIQRAGDVIPQVVQVLKELRPAGVQLWVPPDMCPSCSGELTTSKDKHVTNCRNSKCPGRHSRQVICSLSLFPCSSFLGALSFQTTAASTLLPQ
jgi:predicted Zn-ribbon and HTH transcriptional regulator